jgi:hypothetical protein
MIAKKISFATLSLKNPITNLLMRHFNSGGMMGGIKDDEFLPDREMAEI